MKTVVGIFAHPDDEAFGPAGTIAKFAKKQDVFIVCATSGEGQEKEPEAQKKLGEIRRKELLESARILGVKKVYFLGFEDGTLSNHLYHAIAKRIQKTLDKIKPDTLITFENRGISGHLDHIAISMVTTYVFYKVSYIQTLMYYCLSQSQIDAQKEIANNYFIYFPPGYTESQINKTVGVADVWGTKVKAMMAHKSQKADADRILSASQKRPKEENFIVLTKEKEKIQ